MRYRIEYSPRGRRQFRALSRQVQQRLTPRIEALAEEPRPHGVIQLAGEEGLYRIRVGDYRIIYAIKDDVLLVLIVSVGHRSEVYREL
jgi:mRNA interferase RelE/StbE